MATYKIDLGCGRRKQDGYLGLDVVPLAEVDVICNLENGIPLKDNCVTSVYSNQFLEHVQDVVFVMQEIYRVSRPGAKVTLRAPYYTSIGAFKDPTHKNFFTEETFKYFSSFEWERFNYRLSVNFQVERITYTYMRPFGRLGSMLPSALMYPFRRFLWNVVHTMISELRVIK